MLVVHIYEFIYLIWYAHCTLYAAIQLTDDTQSQILNNVKCDRARSPVATTECKWNKSELTREERKRKKKHETHEFVLPANGGDQFMGERGEVENNKINTTRNSDEDEGIISIRIIK